MPARPMETFTIRCSHPGKSWKSRIELIRRLVGEADIQVFAFERPIPRQRVLDTSADSPACLSRGSRTGLRRLAYAKKYGLSKVHIARCDATGCEKEPIVTGDTCPRPRGKQPVRANRGCGGYRSSRCNARNGHRGKSEKFQPLISVSAPNTNRPFCQLNPASPPPVTPMGWSVPVPAATMAATVPGLA